MPAKKRMPRNTGIILLRAPMHGQGAKEDVFSFIKAHPNKPGVLDEINRGLKKTKIISRGLMAVAPLVPKYGTALAVAGTGAGMLGYGKPKRKRKAPVKKRKAPAKKRKAKK